MGPLTIPLTAAVPSSPEPTKANTQKIADSARQFEALLIGQLLKSAHGDSQGWLGAGDDDESSSTAIQVAEEYLGQALANGGGLGIAKMVIQGLNKTSAISSNSGHATAQPNTPHTDSPASE